MVELGQDNEERCQNWSNETRNDMVVNMWHLAFRPRLVVNTEKKF